jgi:hypothetical protein
METYHIRMCGVLLIAYDKQSVLNWIKYSIEKGIVPSIERVRTEIH